jgi:hypothetical protein
VSDTEVVRKIANDIEPCRYAHPSSIQTINEHYSLPLFLHEIFWTSELPYVIVAHNIIMLNSYLEEALSDLLADSIGLVTPTEL